MNISSLEKVIKEAEALNKADYTLDSWAALEAVLADARNALSAKESQNAVDEAANRLNSAIAALNKVQGPGTNTNTGTGDDQTANANQTTSGAGNQDSGNTARKAPRTGDPSNIVGLLALAAASLGSGGITLKRRRRSR